MFLLNRTFEGCFFKNLAVILNKVIIEKRYMADLLETAVNAGSFKTLVKAVEAAGLVDIIKSPGPYTIFAPTDEAFAKLPEGTLEGLLEDKEKLKKILLYHAVFGEVLEENLAELDEAPTVEGSVVAIAHTDGYQVNEAKIVKTDILADNGVIHIVDTVLMPAMVSGHVG